MILKVGCYHYRYLLPLWMKLILFIAKNCSLVAKTNFHLQPRPTSQDQLSSCFRFQQNCACFDIRYPPSIMAKTKKIVSNMFKTSFVLVPEKRCFYCSQNCFSGYYKQVASIMVKNAFVWTLKEGCFCYYYYHH